MLKALRLAEYEIEIDTEWAWNDFSGLKSNIHSAQVFVSSRIVKKHTENYQWCEIMLEICNIVWFVLVFRKCCLTNTASTADGDRDAISK